MTIQIEEDKKLDSLNKQTQKQLIPKFLPVKLWVKIFGYIPEGGLRHLIFSNPEFSRRVVRRVGRKVLLDVQEMDAWIGEQK